MEEISIGGVALIGTIPEEGPSGLQIVPTSELQEVKTIQGTGSGTGSGGLHTDLSAGSPSGSSDGIQLFDRGNYKHVITFSVARQHLKSDGTPDPDGAEYFLSDHLFQIESIGVDVLTMTNAAGTYFYVPAFARVTRATYEGCSSLVSYQITAGRVSKTNGTTGGGFGLD